MNEKRFKFKKGDRVRCIKHDNASVKGRTGTVSTAHGDGNVTVKFDKPFSFETTINKKKHKIEIAIHWFTPDQLEKIASSVWGQERI